MATTEQKLGEWNCPAEEYHSSEYIGHSMLDDFRRSRRYFHAVHIAKTLPRPEPTAAMRLGTFFHLAVLEPTRFAAEVVREPKLDKRTKDGKAAYADFCDEHAGKSFISADDYETVSAMSAAIQQNDLARSWLSQPGKTEHSITWQDGPTGLLCKSRRDRVLDGLLIDLKKCRDPSPEGFSKAAAAFGYGRQAAYYLDGELATTERDARFIFIAVGDSAPHEVAIYELNPEDVADARAQNRKALSQLAACIEYDDWLGPHEKQVTLLSLPRWTKYQDEWEIE